MERVWLNRKRWTEEGGRGKVRRGREESQGRRGEGHRRKESQERRGRENKGIINTRGTK